MRRLSLVQRFGLQSAAFVGVMALVLGGALTLAVRTIYLDAAARAAQTTADQVLLPHLSDDNFAAGMLTAQAQAELRRFVADNKNSGGISAIKVWSRDGRLVFSTNAKDQIGFRYPEDNALKLALAGTRTREVVGGGDEKSKKMSSASSAIRVDAPILGSAGTETIGAVEVYQPYAPVQTEIVRIVSLIWMIVIGGALPSYFLQMRFLRRTSVALTSAERDLREVNRRLEVSLDNLAMHSLGTLQALVAAVDAKDSYTARHSMAVTDYAVAIGRHLGLPDSDIVALERAGLLHDVGKIGTPEIVLLKPALLDELEFEVIREHPEMSGHIVETIPFLAELAPVVRAHHERWDGLGYPDALAGANIPLLARILSVADAFDAMTSDRPYRTGVPVVEACIEIATQKNGQFDPRVVDALLGALDAGEVKVLVHQIPSRRVARTA